MATYSPFNRIREEVFTNVSGTNVLVTTIPKRSLISAKITTPTAISNAIEVYFLTGSPARKNAILWYNEDFVNGSYVNGASIVDAGTQIRIESSGNFMSFILTIIEID